MYTINAQIVSQKQTERDGIVTSLRFRTDTVPVTMDKAKEILNSINKMQAADEWRLEKSSVDKQETKHQYYLQYYKGIRVAYGTYALHGNDRGQLESAIGNFQKIDQVNTTAQLSESEALQHAMKHIGAELYKWQIPEEERWIKEYLNDTYYPQGEMVIVKDILQGSNQYRLAYKFDIYAHKPLSRYMVYVDAIDGRILDKDSRIHHTNSQGTATTRYSGTRNIITDLFGGGFRLCEVRNGVRIETYNMNNTGTYSQIDFVDNDNNWIEHDNENRDNAALDAHWGAEMTYDYFRQVHGRNSYDNGGAPLLSYVNANLTMISPRYTHNDNAFWDGNRMTYGRGTNFDPFTTLDFCAHEIAHGVTGHTARLAYRKESGAINEALSDIWAACIEARSAPEKQRWLMGEDIGAIRSMRNPNQFNDPDTYLGTYWINTNNCTPISENDYCGVHRNSGVINHWFFLLSEGGTGTNDIGNSFWVGAIGMNNAARIVYRTQSVILQSSVEQEISFAQFREATITAASNIFGNNSYEVAQVTNAWYAVGVGDRYQYRISGPLSVCDQATYTVENLPPGATVQWSVSNSNIATINSSSGVLTCGGNGICEVRATINNSSVILTPLKICLGTPISQDITLTVESLNSNGTLCTDNPNAIMADHPGGNRFGYIREYEWRISNGWQITHHPGDNGIYADNFIVSVIPLSLLPGSPTVSVRARSECGWGAWKEVQIPAVSCSRTMCAFTLSPNPATDEVTLQLTETDEVSGLSVLSTERIPYEIQLWSGMTMLRSFRTNEPTFQISMAGLPAGLYFVRVVKDGQTYTQKLIKK